MIFCWLFGSADTRLWDWWPAAVFHSVLWSPLSSCEIAVNTRPWKLPEWYHSPFFQPLRTVVCPCVVESLFVSMVQRGAGASQACEFVQLDTCQ